MFDCSGKVIAQDEGRVHVSFFGVHVLVGSFGVQDVGVLGAAVGDFDEVFVWFWEGEGDGCWGEE